MLVERHRAAHESVLSSLQKKYDVTTVQSGKQAAAQAATVLPQAVIIDALSMSTNGDRIVRQVKNDIAGVPVFHLRPAGEGSSGADVVLTKPFTARKLINALERVFESQRPATRDERILRRGNFSLQQDRRILTAHGIETQLTPKLALLVDLFFQHPNETLDRSTLMQKVWNTDYIGDTRTLDVHIRWFRRAIEKNPARPVYLKTVRGIGYRFEPSADA
ncbi:MAG: response regulator transcription factor [Pleurocapsa minor GSE-CHR-MK-17-07R]|nr:response regulator transcription factor [Pleurocapsa minor GSE-CHR-MK 17-07R]